MTTTQTTPDDQVPLTPQPPEETATSTPARSVKKKTGLILTAAGSLVAGALAMNTVFSNSEWQTTTPRPTSRDQNREREAVARGQAEDPTAPTKTSEPPKELPPEVINRAVADLPHEPTPTAPKLEIPRIEPSEAPLIPTIPTTQEPNDRPPTIKRASIGFISSDSNSTASADLPAPPVLIPTAASEEVKAPALPTTPPPAAAAVPLAVPNISTPTAPAMPTIPAVSLPGVTPPSASAPAASTPTETSSPAPPSIPGVVTPTPVPTPSPVPAPASGLVLPKIDVNPPAKRADPNPVLVTGESVTAATSKQVEPATPPMIPSPALPIPGVDAKPPVAVAAPSPVVPSPAPVVIPSSTGSDTAMSSAPAPVPVPSLTPAPVPVPTLTPEPTPTPAEGTLTLTKPQNQTDTAVTTLPAARPEAKPASNLPAPRTDFDVDLYEPKPGDSYESISKRHYDDARFAEALRAFNRGMALSRGVIVQVPPIYVLREKFAPYIQQAAATVPQVPEPDRRAASVTQAGAWQPVGGQPAADVSRSTYTVARDGMTMWDVAEDVYRDRREWKRIYDANPRFDPNERLPVGTRLMLPQDGRADRE